MDALIRAAHAGNQHAVKYFLDLGGDLRLANCFGNTPLHAAVLSGKVSMCSYLLDNGANVEAVDADSVTPLHLAVFRGDYEILELLIDKGADVNAVFTKGLRSGILRGVPLITLFGGGLGCSPKKDRRFFDRVMAGLSSTDLLSICREISLQQIGADWSSDSKHQDWDICIILLGYNEEEPHEGNIADACRNGDDDLFSELLAAGGYLNEVDADGMSFLELAIANGWRTWVDILLAGETQIGTNEAIRIMKSQDKYIGELKTDIFLHQLDVWDISTTGETLLEAALLHGDEDIRDQALGLCLSGYDSGVLCAVVQRFSGNELVTIVESILDNRSASRDGDILEGTAIVMVASMGQYPLLHLLLSTLPISMRCRVPRIRSHFEQKNWGFQYWRRSYKDDASTFSTILELCDESIFSRFIERGYKPGRSDLVDAIEKGNTTLVKALLEAKPIPLHVGPKREWASDSPLNIATRGGDVAMIQLLIEIGQDVNEDPQGPGSRSALQFAVEREELAIIRLLLEAGADVNGKPARKNGATALQVAAILGSLGIAKLLLDLEPPADIDARRARAGGRTALEGAAEHGRIDMVKLLLAYGVKTTGRGQRQYLRAMKFAEANGHEVVVHILKDHRQLTALEKLSLKDKKLMEDGVTVDEFSDIEQWGDALSSDDASDLESSSSSEGWSGPDDWECSDDD